MIFSKAQTSGNVNIENKSAIKQAGRPPGVACRIFYKYNSFNFRKR